MKHTLNGTELTDATTVVVGGTGNVGFFLVDGYLRAGARVIVPTRAEEKFSRLLTRLDKQHHGAVTPLYGDIGSPEGAAQIARQLREYGASLDAVAASPATWHQNQSMFQAGFADFKNTIETRLYPHYLAAEALLPLLAPDGSYVTINGPAAFAAGPPHPGTGSIATASAAQNTMMRAFAAETGGVPRINEVVMWAYLGPSGTRDGSTLRGEQVGDYVAALSSPAAAAVHGHTFQLRTSEQVTAALAGRFDTAK